LETKAERQHKASVDRNKSRTDILAPTAWTDEDQRVVDNVSGKGTPSFPRHFLDSFEDVYWLGHHNEKSFGATPYLFRTLYKGKSVWIMVDTPRYSKSAITAVESLIGPGRGPDYLFLTHVDDTADHQRWADHYASTLKRIIHSLELSPSANWLNDKTLETAEIQLPPPSKLSSDTSLVMYTLDGEEILSHGDNDDPVVILHTPGHSPGSITLYRKPDTQHNLPGILFTGDTYAWTTRDGGRMTGFGRYGNNRRQQAETLASLLALDWTVIAPGHGHPRDYRELETSARKADVIIAQEDLVAMAKL